MAFRLPPQITDENLKQYLLDLGVELDLIPRIPQILTINNVNELPTRPVIGQRIYVKTAITGFTVGFYTYVNDTDRWIAE